MFARLEVSGRNVLYIATSRICWKCLVASLRRSHLAFLPYVSLNSKEYNHTILSDMAEVYSADLFLVVNFV